MLVDAAPEPALVCCAVLCRAVACSVLRLDLASMGPLKTLPYLVMFGMSNAGGWAGDWLILSQHRSVAAARKAVNTLGKSQSLGRGGEATVCGPANVGQCCRHAQ